MTGNDGELGRALMAAKSTKTTGNFALIAGAIAVALSLFAGLNGSGFGMGAILLLISGIALRISAATRFNNTMWRIAFGAIGRPAPRPWQVPADVGAELNLVLQLAVAEYAERNFAVPLDDLFVQLVRERTNS